MTQSLISMFGALIGVLIGMKTMTHCLDRGKTTAVSFLAVLLAGSMWSGFIFILLVGVSQ